MNCADYLAMLATVPVQELDFGGAREHAARCHDCDRVTRVVAERERNMLVAFGALRSDVPASRTAASALMLARRRRVALLFQIVLGVAALATMLAMWMVRRVPMPLPSATITETFRLQCLSPAQAGELLRPFISAASSITFREGSPIAVMSVDAPREQMVMVRSVLNRYDSPTLSQCAAQVTVPRIP